MSKDITLLGASYTGVPAVQLPQTGGGTATFTDTSDANAVASDIAQGKTAYVNGAKITGTNSGGSDIPIFSINVMASPITVTCNKTYSECLSYYENDMTAAALAEIIRGQDTLYMAVSAVASYSQQVAYAIYDWEGTPTASIEYNSDGTLTYVEPSTIDGYVDTPVATKGTVSNHTISVTPSVSVIKGHVNGGTRTGTPVTVSASELVSGSETKTANGTYDVTNLASIVVNVPYITYYTGSSTPSASLGNNNDIYLKVVT